MPDSAEDARALPEGLEARIRDRVGDEVRLDDVLVVERRPLPERLLGGTPFSPLSGLARKVDLEPFVTESGVSRWFDLYLPAEKISVTVTGETSPTLVLTSARLPVRARQRRSIRLDAGTVWIRVDAVGPGFPAGSYVGIAHVGGTLNLGQTVPAGGGSIAVAAPFAPVLDLRLVADAATPGPDGCTGAGASLTLPAALRIAITAAGPVVSGDPARAGVWGASLVATPGGTPEPWEFVPRLWSAVLPAAVAPGTLGPLAVDDGLIRVAGTGAVLGGGLSLPVVQVADPATLGAASRGAEVTVEVSGLEASWYEDVRPHPLPIARLGVSNRGALLLAEGVPELTPAVVQETDLWTLGTGPHRLPWRSRWDAPFWLLSRCDVVDGASLIVSGAADVALDRPVTVDGSPLPTPTGVAATWLRRVGGTTRVLLAAAVASSTAEHRFALRNAFVWTGGPRLVSVEGELVGRRDLRSGTARVSLPLSGWIPTLPDPYVANLGIGERGRQTGVSLVAAVSWSDPSDAVLRFDGSLGAGFGGVLLAPSEGGPRPSHAGREPAVGATQVQQHALAPDRAQSAARKEARARVESGRAAAVERAAVENSTSRRLLEGALVEVVGAPPAVTLIDVSTNQDLLGVGIAGSRGARVTGSSAASEFPVDGVTVRAPGGRLRVVALPQVQWEPVRTLDSDQDIVGLGWFPTPLASADDGGATQIGSRSQKLMPIVPDDALSGTVAEFRAGVPMGIRTTFPFGLVAAVRLDPLDAPGRRADVVEIPRPEFPAAAARGALQLSAVAEGGRADDGGVSPTFAGAMRQLIEGVDLASGAPLGLSVLASTGDSDSDVETIFNNDMAARPRVPVRRFDVSGYGGSGFSDWQDPFAAFAATAKVQFRYSVGRVSLEIVKVSSVLHPWGVRVTRSVTIERRPGGGVIRRDSGWRASTPGIFDYRYLDEVTTAITVPDYRFDTGVFRGLFDVRSIRPGPGAPFSSGAATFVPYLFDAEAELESVVGRTPARGVLGFLQTTPTGAPAPRSDVRALLEQRGPVGGPVDAWMPLGGSGLPFRAQRIEVGLADDAGTPLFVATVRGAPRLPTTGAWSVVRRPVGAAPGAGEAVTVGGDAGVPLIRRNPIVYPAGLGSPAVGPAGDHRLADAADLLVPTAPATEYALLQSTATHAFLFPRPFAPLGASGALRSGDRVALAVLIARSTSKGAFPPPENTIRLAPGSHEFAVGPSGTLALSAPIDIVGHPTPLRVVGTPGHGSTLRYDTSRMRLELDHTRWAADFTGLRLMSDIAGVNEVTGNQLRIVGSTEQRPQIAGMRGLMLADIERVLQYIPIFGARKEEGPIDLGATNAQQELRFEVGMILKFPIEKVTVSAADPEVSLAFELKSTAGFDPSTGGLRASSMFGAEIEGRIPVYTVGVASVFIIVALRVEFSLTAVTGTATAERLELTAFVGVGLKGQIGIFEAYSFLGVGFVFVWDALTSTPKYGGLVALEAGIDLTIVEVKVRAELKGLVYSAAGKTLIDYSGSVEVNVDILFFISISASYEISETATL